MSCSSEWKRKLLISLNFCMVLCKELNDCMFAKIVGIFYWIVKPSPVPSCTGLNEGVESQTGHLLFRTLELLREATYQRQDKIENYRRKRRRLVLEPEAMGRAPCRALPRWMIAQPRLEMMTTGLLG